MVLVAAYAFLSIHLDGLSVLDFLSFVVSFYITEQQIFEWEDPTGKNRRMINAGSLRSSLIGGVSKQNGKDQRLSDQQHDRLRLQML